MSRSAVSWMITLAILSAMPSFALAVEPFVENFPNNREGWVRDTPGTIPSDWQPAGGPNPSSHISTDFNAFGLGGPAATHILFQARDEFAASDHAFEGNWLASGIDTFSMRVRHNATQPLPFFARFTNAAGAAGVAAASFVPGASEYVDDDYIRLEPEQHQ